MTAEQLRKLADIHEQNIRLTKELKEKTRQVSVLLDLIDAIGHFQPEATKKYLKEAGLDV